MDGCCQKYALRKMKDSWMMTKRRCIHFLKISMELKKRETDKGAVQTNSKELQQQFVFFPRQNRICPKTKWIENSF